MSFGLVVCLNKAYPEVLGFGHQSLVWPQALMARSSSSVRCRLDFESLTWWLRRGWGGGGLVPLLTIATRPTGKWAQRKSCLMGPWKGLYQDKLITSKALGGFQAIRCRAPKATLTDDSR